MINGHLINHYYIIELFNDLIGKNHFPQSRQSLTNIHNYIGDIYNLGNFLFCRCAVRSISMTNIVSLSVRPSPTPSHIIPFPARQTCRIGPHRKVNFESWQIHYTCDKSSLSFISRSLYYTLSVSLFLSLNSPLIDSLFSLWLR